MDEHRFARARFFRDDTGGWQRVEPWMSTFVNTDTGQVLGIEDGRNSTGIQRWLDVRTPGLAGLGRFPHRLGHIPLWAYDGCHGTRSDDVGRVQRDRRAAAPGHPDAAAGG